MIVDLDSAIELAVYNRLLAWPGLTALVIKRYRGVPAIFTRFPVPEDAPDEFVVLGPPVTDVEASSKTSRGRELMRDVSSYTLATGDPTRVNAIAAQVRAALRRWQPDLGSGTRVLVAEPSGPIANDGDSTYGRVISIRLIVHGA